MTAPQVSQSVYFDVPYRAIRNESLHLRRLLRLLVVHRPPLSSETPDCAFTAFRPRLDILKAQAALLFQLANKAENLRKVA